MTPASILMWLEGFDFSFSVACSVNGNLRDGHHQRLGCQSSHQPAAPRRKDTQKPLREKACDNQQIQCEFIVLISSRPTTATTRLWRCWCSPCWTWM